MVAILKPVSYIGEMANKQLKDLLPNMLESLAKIQSLRPDLVLEAWPEVIGEKLAHMTEAASFIEGVLQIKVKNATLYSLLVQHERVKILDRLRKRFPKVEIRNIIFRIG